MPLLPDYVLDARRRLAEGCAALESQHDAGWPGAAVCALLAELRDTVVRQLFAAALDELAPAADDVLRTQTSLVAHGGYGRRDVAPHSDVDLMILHAGRAGDRVAALAGRLWRDLVDAGLRVGHSVRTPDEAASLAYREPTVVTSLVETRLLAGSDRRPAEFSLLFRRHLRRQPQKVMAAIVDQRAEERERYGETVYLLEPNVKRSAGGLRDLHLIRWIGLVRYGTPDPAALRDLGVLSPEDVAALGRANEFLLRLRNEMHFHAGRATDVLDRAEQVRVAERLGHEGAAGQLPVERFMQHYFRHSGQVSYIAGRFVAQARSRRRLNRLLTTVFGHQIEPGLGVGPSGLVSAPNRWENEPDPLAAVLRMADLANQYNEPIAPETWDAIRRIVPRDGEPPSAEARRHFLSLLDNPARLATLLRDLHGTGVLERFVPAMARARGLLEFNQYHQYTVDEHCLRAVGFATRLLFDMGPLGRTYRAIGSKRVLHLALLLHDLGKGFEEDHCQLGREIARQTANTLELSEHETQTLVFLVEQHLLMNHLAFHRDTTDEPLAIGFAREVGSPELLKMLFVLTASDLAAVGPGVWDAWKDQILTGLFHRTMEHLAGDSPATTPDDAPRRRREAVRAALGAAADDGESLARIDALPDAYLLAVEPEQVASDLRLLAGAGPGGARAEGRYVPETDTVEYTVATHEETAHGVFHRLTGALTSHALEIRSARIHTLTGGLILDRFWVRDLDHDGPPPRERLDEISAALVESLRASADASPEFRPRRRADRRRRVTVAPVPTRVSADNDASNRYTILDVFAEDRLGMLHAIARTIFEMDLSVWRAKISTYGDRVVNVFYVTDEQGQKIADDRRLEQVRRQLTLRIDAMSKS